MQPWLIWLLWGLFGLGYELYALWTKRSGDTLSENTRLLFHTYERTGRMIWLLIWGGFSVWFLVHIAFTGTA